ncbi:uncharacterized protein PAC_13550 [Phialocephala subalpina]|uniref:Uncharacterized protein n=1 Tax=Phialocephala subalpina TaxID=576137 RepID=A0A1L7XF53_9HELO|nr:uncharacterized protein PAC_13550 [Phialocephala subalpina]
MSNIAPVSPMSHDGYSNDKPTPAYETVQFLDSPNTSISGKKQKQKIVGLKTISFLFALVFLPLIAFSVVILYFIFHYRVAPENSRSTSSDLQTTPNENHASYYYVNFSATTLLFITSWSSTVAPMLVGMIMTLSLFPISKKLFKLSLSDNPRRLPTPNQFAILLGLSEGRILALWNYIRYIFRRNRAGQSAGLTLTACVYIIAIVISTLIVIDDTVLHITTKTVSIYETTAIPSPNVTLGKGLNAACANWTAQTTFDFNLNEVPLNYPCTTWRGTSAGLFYPNEVFQTINNISSDNQVLQVSSGNSSTGDLFLLGPSASQRSSNTDYRATTIGVSTSCQAISTLCDLQAPVGASTSFNCSSGWSGNIQVPEYDPTGLIQTGIQSSTGGSYNFTSKENNFGLGVFGDRNLSIAYNITNYNASLPHTTYNPFYLGVAALAQSANQAGNLSSDPEIVEAMHGGNAFVLRCEVNTYDVIYSYVNGTISPASVNAVMNNGTVGWNFLGPMTFQQERLGQMVDLAGVQNTSAELGLSYGNSFSSLGVALLAGSYTGRTVLEQQVRNEILVAKVLKSAIWLLVLFNLLFAILGGLIAVWAFLVALTGTGDAHALFSVEEVVGMCFEREKFGGRGEVEDRFEERKIGEMSGRVGLMRREEGWALRRVNVHD